MTLHIHLLGSPHILLTDMSKNLGGKPLALLAYLLLTGRPQTRQHLVDLLYDEANDPRRALRWTLNKLKQAIGVEYLLADRQQIGFNFEAGYWLDVAALEGGDTAVYAGDFLENVQIQDGQRFEEWAFFQRERLRTLFLNQLAEQLSHLNQQGNHKAIISLAERLLQFDPLNESGRRHLMRAYALLGQKDAALAQYNTLRQMLSNELQIEPDDETEEVRQQILAGTLANTISLSHIEPNLPSFLSTKTQTLTRPPFVAREAEVEMLDHYLEIALTGKTQVAFITGTAGRGKTALAHAFARQAIAQHQQLLVAWGNCNAFSGLGDPYLPFRDIMEMMTGDIEAKVVAEVINLEHGRRLWHNLLPATQAILKHGSDLLDVLVAHKALLARVELATANQSHEVAALRQLSRWQKPSSAEIEQSFVFQQFMNVIEAIAARQPLLLMIDDLHWADASSIALLFHLSRRLNHSPLFILGTYRPEEIAQKVNGERHLFQKAVAEIKRDRGEIVIDLSHSDTVVARRFIDSLLDSEPNQLDDAFRKAMVRHTAGHALFTVELLRTMQERGDLIQDENGRWTIGQQLDWSHLPARVEAVIAERIDRLHEEMRDSLAIASVEGESFTAEVVSRVQQLDKKTLLRKLSGQLSSKHRLVRELGEKAVNNLFLSLFKFNHVLFQQYLYRELGTAQRRLLHRQVGETLETLYGEEDVRMIAPQLVRHFERAGNQTKQLHYLKLAGKSAKHQYAIEESLTYFTKALTLTNSLEEQFDLLIETESVHELMGNLEARRKDITFLLELAKKLDKKHQTNLYQMKALLRHCYFEEKASKFESALESARKIVDTAAGEEPLPLELLAQAHIRWGSSLLQLGSYTHVAKHFNQALSYAQQVANPNLQATALISLGIVTWRLGNIENARSYYHQALEIFEQVGNQRQIANIYNYLGALAYTLGELAEAEKLFTKALEQMRLVGYRSGKISILNNLGVIGSMQHDFQMATHYYSKSLALSQLNEDAHGAAFSIHNLGYVGIKTGDVEGGIKLVNQAYERRLEMGNQTEICSSLRALGLGHLKQGNVDQARSFFERAISKAREVNDKFELSRALFNLGHVLILLEELEQAEHAFEESILLRENMKLPYLMRESQAGLAWVANLRGEDQLALAYVGPILELMAKQSLFSTDNPMLIYYICFQVLRDNNDPRSREILSDAYHLIQRQAAALPDEAARQMYLQNIPENRAIIHEYWTHSTKVTT